MALGSMYRYRRKSDCCVGEPLTGEGLLRLCPSAKEYAGKRRAKTKTPQNVTAVGPCAIANLHLAYGDAKSVGAGLPRAIRKTRPVGWCVLIQVTSTGQ